MILGTYLIMPIFNKWILHSSLDELEYFHIIWLITCLFTFTLKTDFPIKLTYFTSPIGLVVLGYYLRYSERKLLNNPYFGILLVAISSAAMLAFSYIYSSGSSFYNFDRYSFPTTLVVIGAFILFKNFSKLNFDIRFLSKEGSIFRRFTFSLARYSYGIYLIHTAVLSVIFRTFDYGLFNNYAAYALFLFIADLIISVMIMSVLNRIPYINQIIGAK